MPEAGRASAAAHRPVAVVCAHCQVPDPGTGADRRGKVRVNRLKIDKTSMTVKPGDVLTLSLGPRVISIEILKIGARRGPAAEAQTLYRDLTPRQPPAISASAEETEQAGPTSRLAVRIEGRAAGRRSVNGA